MSDSDEMDKTQEQQSVTGDRFSGSTDSSKTAGEYSSDSDSEKKFPVIPLRIRIYLILRTFFELHWPELFGAVVAALFAIILALLIAFLSFPYPQSICTVKSESFWSEWSVCLPCGLGKGTKYRNRTVTFSSDTKNTSCIQTNQVIKCNAGPCCDDGFVSDSYLLNCFKVMPIIRTWYSARTLAGQLNGDLAVIDFRQKHEFLVKAAIQVIKVEDGEFHFEPKFWIGLRCPDTRTMSACMWTNGDNVTFTRFANPFPRKKFSGPKKFHIRCTYLDLTNFYQPVWRIDNCDSQYRLIIEQNTSALSECAKNDSNINYCYQVVNDTITWEQASTHGLVTINSPTEQSHIMSLINGTSSIFWIGFSCFVDSFIPSFGCVVRDKCRWIDGSGLTYNNHSNLIQYYTNCTKHNIGCLTINGQGDWNFRNCSDNLPYIVEERPFCDKLSGSSWSEWSDCIVSIDNSLKHLCGAGTRTRTIGYNLTGEACPNPTSYNISQQQCHVTCQKECKNIYKQSGLQFCYAFEDKKSFEQLRTTETPLVTIETKQESDYVIKIIDKYVKTYLTTTIFYIGLVCDRDDDYRFCRWINNQHSPLNFNKFAFGHPRVPNENYRCVAIQRLADGIYTWVSVNCNEELDVFNGRSKIIEATPTICYKFHYFSNVKYYQLPCNRQTWIEHSHVSDHYNCPTVAGEKERLCLKKEACMSLPSLNFDVCFALTSMPVTFNQYESFRDTGPIHQTDLVVIDSKEKQNYIMDVVLYDERETIIKEKDLLIQQRHCVTTHGRYFIGLQCFDTGVIDECIWLLLNKPIKEIPNKYHNFLPGQPNMGPNPDVLPHFCVVLNSTRLNGTWYSVPCNLSSCFVEEFGPQCNKFGIYHWENVTYKCAALLRNGSFEVGDPCVSTYCESVCHDCGLQLLHSVSHNNCPTIPLQLKVEYKSECCYFIEIESHQSDRYSPWCHFFSIVYLPPSITLSCNATSIDVEQASLAIIDTFHEWYSMATGYKYNYEIGSVAEIEYPVWTAGYCEPNGTCFCKIEPCLPEFTFPADDYAFWEYGRKPQIHKRMCAAVLNNKYLLSLVDCKTKFTYFVSLVKSIPIVNRTAAGTFFEDLRLPEQFIMPSYFTRRHDCSYYDFEQDRTCFNCPPWILPKNEHNCFICSDPYQHWKELRQNFSYCYKVTEEKFSMVDAESWYEFDGGPIVPRYLATIRSYEEQDYIKNLLKSENDTYLIGIQCWDLAYDTTCFWRDATLLQFENFAVGEPDYFDVINNITRCAVLNMTLNGLWKAVSCDESHYLVLERLPICNKFDPWLVVNLPARGFMSSWKVTGNFNISSVSVKNSLCPFVNERKKLAGLPSPEVCNELLKNADYCYWAGRDERSAFEREKRPLNYNWFVAFGRDLASIDNEQEQRDIISNLGLSKSQYLIGLYCPNENREDCKWMDGSKLSSKAYHLFKEGNPIKSQHCVVLNIPSKDENHKPRWTSTNCSQGVTNYILEYAPSCSKTNIKFRPLCPACHNIDCHLCKCGWSMNHPIGCPQSNSPKFLGSCCQGKAINGINVCVKLIEKKEDWNTWKNTEENDQFDGRLLVINNTQFIQFFLSGLLIQHGGDGVAYTAGVCYKGKEVKCYWPGLKRINSTLFGLDKITLDSDKQPLLIEHSYRYIDDPSSFTLKFKVGHFDHKLKALFSYRKYDPNVLPPFYDF